MPGHVRSLWTERPIERRTRAIRTITLRGATAISFRKTFPTCCAENAGKAVDVELILVVVYQFLDLLIESCRARSFGQRRGPQTYGRLRQLPQSCDGRKPAGYLRFRAPLNPAGAKDISPDPKAPAGLYLSRARSLA